MKAEDYEALISVARHHGMPHFMALIDQIVTKIEQEVLSVPLQLDPDKASYALYAKRMQAEGAGALRNALKVKISELKSKMEEKINERSR